MKKRIFFLTLTLVLLIGALSAFSVVAGAQSPSPELSISYCNLSFQDSVYIKYAVKANVSDVKILVWTSPETEYTVGTHDSEITQYYSEDINGVSHMIFDYTELSAKQMTDVVYARAYSQVDGIDYYSEVNKYSILQYAYNKLGKTATASTDTKLKEMLTNMLSYGASAQKYFDYNEDRLATADWYQVKLTAGTLDDGCTHGLYLPGDKVTFIAPQTDANGEAFSHWEDSKGNQLATTATYELTVGNTREVYTPIYNYVHNHTVVIDDAVAPTCSATGLTEGKHCSACGEVIIAQEVVAATGKHDFSEWQTVKEATTAEEGLMERSCDCGEKETKIIEKIVPELAYTLNADGQSYSVTGIGNWTDSNVIIPDTYKGLPVTSIAAESFKNCTALIDITIPACILEIGEHAFRGCTNLKSVYISDLAKWCEISFKRGNNSAYFNSSNPLWLGADLYINGEKASSIIISENVTSISHSAFVGCSSLTDIRISDSVTSLGAYAFENCSNLKSVTLGNGLTEIKHNVFHNCIGLTNITIPDTVTSIGSYAFSGCTGLTSITIPDGVTSIGSDAFYKCIALTSITIPDTVTSIGNYAFCNCTGLTSITIPDSVTSIGDFAFMDCVNLTGITISDSITSIGNSTFRNCKGLTSVTIPDSVTSIGSVAFAKCTGLTSVTIPDSVTNIGSAAFSSCTGLASVTFGDNSQLISIGDQAFLDCNLSSITIPHNVKNIEPLTFAGCSNLKAIYITNLAAWCNFNLTNQYHNPICRYDCDLYLNGGLITDLIIPDGVISINDYAFSGITSITNLTISDSVTCIGENAFSNCTGLTSVTFGDNSQLTSIDRATFSGCTGLASITIPDSVTSIGSSAFSSCTGLASVTFGDNSQLISIGEFAFSSSGLTTITISNNVKKIGRAAFFNCSKLKNIIFKDPLTWYQSNDGYYGGTIIDVTDSYANAKHFSSATYWYKK